MLQWLWITDSTPVSGRLYTVGLLISIGQTVERPGMIPSTKRRDEKHPKLNLRYPDLHLHCTWVQAWEPQQPDPALPPGKPASSTEPLQRGSSAQLSPRQPYIYAGEFLITASNETKGQNSQRPSAVVLDHEINSDIVNVKSLAVTTVGLVKPWIKVYKFDTAENLYHETHYLYQISIFVSLTFRT